MKGQQNSVKPCFKDQKKPKDSLW